jgi:photosystem II stability/assembly factor-like uncharacterized protein
MDPNPDMNKLSRFLFILGIGPFAGLMVQNADAETGMDVEYAEHMPLSTESVLLDITRVGNTLVAVGERGHVVTSTDGESWQQAEVVPTRSTLTTVFSLGDRLWAGGHDAVIITSGDGGDTWTLEFFDPERQQAVMDILFTDNNNGVAIGSYGLFLQTIDGGQNWEETMIDEENDYHLNGLVRFDDGHRYIAGEAGYSYLSNDDGVTWQAMGMPYQGSMWGVIQTGGDCMLMYGLRGHVMESCDAGSSWNELDTGSEASISGAAEHEGQVLLAANSGTILLRDNSGKISVHQHSSGGDFAAALSLGDGSFMLVGEDGVNKFPETTEKGER